MYIKYNRAAYILRFNKNHLIRKWLCKWKLEPIKYGGYVLTCRWKIFAYLLFFIPTAIISFFYSVWSGGIKEMEILPFRLNTFTFHKYDLATERIEEVLRDIESEVENEVD